MSYIGFETRAGDLVKVSGAERAHLGIMTGMEVLDVVIGDVVPEVLRVKLATGWWEDVKGTGTRQAQWVKLALVHDQRPVFPGVDNFNLLLNTALIIEARDLRLAARLHGQCELNAWVAGRDRAWFAGLVERDLKAGVLREGMGWEAVIELLGKSSRGAVATSYSVCERPRWREGLPRTGQLQMTPEGWDSFVFGDGVSLLDLMKEQPR